MRIRLIVLAIVAFFTAVSQGEGQEKLAKDAPAHPRPFFMPKSERERILTTIKSQPWAKVEYDRVKALAGKGDGYWAAFLYALEGDAKHLETARKALLARYDAKSYWVEAFTKRLADPNYFKAGQPGIPEVYYDLDISGAIMYDWVYTGLSDADRKVIEHGLLVWAQFRMRCMDRWTQTPNLVFKPTYLVALIGLALQNQECIDWGFHRTKPWGKRLGGYFEVLDYMLKDGGPWHEAPIYPGAHTGLFITAEMSRYRQLYDGKDWFAHKVPSGGSAKGLMDYYLDSAYAIEKTAAGQGQVRCANYGDGSTNWAGDLFLVSPAGNPGDILLHEALIAAHNVSGDPRYAAFLSLLPSYQPDLWNKRALPAKVTMPPAPSKVWPDYGLAMLRSDESPNYWTSGKAIAVFQLMCQGYGHDHRDKFSITLHGANRLFYPDYNAIQYENMAIGWTRNTVCHNTLMVDEQDTRDAQPTGIRHDFSPDVKFLATSASGVFESVEQTRALLLTKEYLLDLFQASSPVPHTYDYILHSFGKVDAPRPDLFKPSDALVKRYWLVEKQQAMTRKEPWSLDLVIKEEPGKRKGNYGKEWYDHVAKLRFTMAAEPGTQVVHGVWGDELAKLVDARVKGAKLDRLTTLVARRKDARNTVFVATHEPYANQEKPQVIRVQKIAETTEAVLVRVDGRDFTDLVAVAFGPQKDNREHVLAADKDVFAFRNYGYLRLVGKNLTARRGDWTGFQASIGGVAHTFGKVPEAPKAELTRLSECPFPVTIAPAVARAFNRDRRTMTFTVTNTLKDEIAGRLTFDLPVGVAIEPERPEFKSIPVGGSTQVKVTFVTDNPKAGRHIIPYKAIYLLGGREKEIPTASRAVTLMVGPTLENLYQHPKPAVFVLHAPKLTAKFDMFHGLCRYLADDDDTVRLDGSPLFTFSDGKTDLLSEKTNHAFTWPRESPADMTAQAYDRCRWQVLPTGNRLLFRMDPGWTQFEKTHFTIPGKWVSPKGAPKWKRIVAIDAQGREYDGKGDGKLRVTTAELEFPGARYHLAFQFVPPQEVAFQGTEMRFILGSLTNDNWQIGYCEPGKLDAWRGK